MPLLTGIYCLYNLGFYILFFNTHIIFFLICMKISYVFLCLLFSTFLFILEEWYMHREYPLTFNKVKFLQ